MVPAWLALWIILASALAGPTVGAEWVERRLGDLGVMFPAGKGWLLEEREPGVWVAGRLEKTATGDPVYLHTILAERFQFPPSFADWLPVEVATDYLLWEIDNLQAKCAEGDEFHLLDLDVRQEQHGGRTLHVLRSVKDYITPWHPMLEMEAQELYLVFLSDFAETTTVYKIFIAANCFFEGCTVDDLDLSEMTPLLDDLRDYSAGPD